MENKKKKKTVELLLPDEFSENAGIDAVAFVDQPAIEVDFMYFKKEEMGVDINAPVYTDETPGKKKMDENLKAALKKMVKILGRPQDDIFNNIHKNFSSRKNQLDLEQDGWSYHVEYKFMHRLFTVEEVYSMHQILEPYFKKGEDVFTFEGISPWIQIKYMKSPEGKIQIISQSKIKNQKKDPGQFFKFVSEDKRIVVSPLMIPNKLIPRIDPITNESYNCFFSESTVFALAEKYMADLRLNNSNIMHNPDDETKITMIESWIVSDPSMDKAAFYGFNVPKGTWMAVIRVNDMETWKKIKNGTLKGLSVEGSFSQIER